MLTPEMKLICRVLSLAFASLAEGDGAILAAALKIEANDEPDAGTNTPSAVFATTTANPESSASDLANAAQVFATSQAQPATVFAPEPELPTYTMTMKAGGNTRETYHAANWTDAQLIEHGYMVAEGPKPAPVTAAVAPPPIAPVAQPVTSTPPAPSPAMQNGAQPQAAAESPVAPPPGSEAGTAVPLDSAHALRDNGGKGIRWDARIHSSSREINEKDGMWRKKRGVDASEVARVTSEILAEAPAAAAPPFVPLAPGAPPVASTPAPVAPPAGAAGEPKNFTELCKWITASGHTMQQAAEKAAVYGIGSMGILAMADNASIIPLVYADLNQ